MNFVTIDNFTIIASIALIILSIVTPMLNPFFRFSKKDNYQEESPDSEPTPAPPLSLVITPFDDAEGLAKNLPHLLQQDYPAAYQVIVVIEQGDHRAEEIIGNIKNSYPDGQAQSHAELYVTYIPQSSRYISRKKLAITLGIKAAKNEWIVLTETSCRPASSQWLSTIGRHCHGENNLVVGYGCFDDNTASYRRFERLHTSFYLMREASRGTAYRDNSYNIAFRKTEFMDGDGYLGNLHLMRGEYDFVVNKHAHKATTALETAEEAWMMEDEPTEKSWLNRHIFYLESRKSLNRGFRHRLPFNIDQAALHLNMLLLLGALAFAGFAQNWILLASATLALIVTFIFRSILCHKALRSFGENISPLGATFYELGILWHNLWYMLRYRMADKHDFTTHKL